MTITIEALKDKARRHEQDEEWRKALDLYLRAIQRLDEEDRPDIGLHNRVGDLYARVGSASEAVEHYETAVDLYEDSGLANNAIAVCKKIIRNVPDRHRVFLRMGMIRARQGFLVDARHHFLTYAERMKDAGDFDEAMRALVEFAEVVPADAEVRLAVASQFEQHDRPDEAAAQLSRAYQILRAEDDERAPEVGERLLALAPDTDLEALAASAQPAAPLETTSFSADDLDAGPVAAPAAAEHEVEEPDLSDFEIAIGAQEESDSEAASADEDLADARQEEFFTAVAGRAADGEENEEDGEDRGAAGEDSGGDVDAFVIDAQPSAMAFGGEPETAGTVHDDPEAALEDADRLDDVYDEDADRLDDTYGEDDEEATPLPFLAGTELPPIEPGPAAPGLADLEVADAWTEPGGGDDLPEEGRPSDASAPISEAPEEEASGEEGFDVGSPGDAGFDVEPPEIAGSEPPEADTAGAGTDAADIAAADARLAMEDAAEEGRSETGPAASVEAPSAEEPDAPATRDEPPYATEGAPPEAEEAPPATEVEACQRAVERAFRAGSEPELVAAYLGLAGALENSGAAERARGVYQQILGIDPGHEPARAALGRIVGAPDPAPEVSSSEDYVDLGALILGDDAEKSTRFVVAYEEPSGDEDADFARMLRQFKAKVAENVDSSDVKAHHDLGVAYREMGLLDEAIEQFQKALRASHDHLATYEALGQAFLDKGAWAPAVRVLSRALDAPWEVEDELLGIYYYLGRAYEAEGNTPQAVEFYDRVFSLDINFADVTERLRALR